MTKANCEPHGKTTDPTVPLWLKVTVVTLFFVLYVFPLNARPLFIPDESRYAEIPREMLDDGNWAAMRLAGLRYYEKPPLGYWLMAASQYTFGHNHFAVRLPSALAAGMAALAVFLLVRRIRGDSTRAWMAAAIYLSCLEVFGVGTFAVLDSMFAMFVCLTMSAYYLAATGEGRRSFAWSVLSGVVCSAAFLTKGFVALVIPALMLVTWLLWERRARELLTAWIVPILSAVVVTLPAVLIVAANNPGYWEYFFWVEHVQRFLDPSGGQHRQVFWFYVPVLAIGAIPWSFFLPAAAAEIRGKMANDSLTRYCLCWFCMQFLFFSACGGKLPTYILPGFAPFAILLADAFFDSRRKDGFRYCALVGSGIFLIALIGFLIWLPFSRQTELRDGLMGDAKTWLLGLAVAATALCLYMASRSFAANRSVLHSVGWVALSLCAPAFASFHCLPERIEDKKSLSRLLESSIPLTPPGALLLSERNALSSVCWYYRSSDVVFCGDAGELNYGLQYSESTGRYFATPGEAGEWLLRMLVSGRPVAVCMRDGVYNEIVAGLGETRPALRREIRPYVWALYLPADRNSLPVDISHSKIVD